MSFKNSGVLLFLVGSLLFFLPAADTRGENPDCLMCHPDLKEQKVVHPAIEMGCTVCHTGVDAGDIPHRFTSGVDRGLSSDQPGLCYGCHDQSMFSQKNVHPAVMMGCTSCHNPHSSNNGKLLVSEPPGLCFNCHDGSGFEAAYRHSPAEIGLCTSCHSPHSSKNEKLLVVKVPDICFSCHDRSGFVRKNVHYPVKEGMCITCHNPHASEYMFLLNKIDNRMCLECHFEVIKSPHAIVGFSTAGHPIGGVRRTRDGKEKSVSDPMRKGKIFYCGSCHDPHSSENPRLFRYRASSTMGLCRYCHKM